MARSGASAATSSWRCFPERSKPACSKVWREPSIEQVSRPYVIEDNRVTIGASVGIAIGDPGRACADAWSATPISRSMPPRATGAASIASTKRRCTARRRTDRCSNTTCARRSNADEIWVAYQPIVRAASEEISGFESLARWNHPMRGPIGPDKFIPLAEECGMIGKIGQFVLQTALKEAADWPDPVRIAVNVSPIQFNDPSIIDIVSAAIAETKIRAERVELEITEGVFLSDSDATDVTFARLKGLGVRLALDDFGTGYSSLGYLKKAPFDKIKIDQSFVRGAASSTNRNSAIIRAIVTLAESLDMDTCAEGVETHDDLQLIRDLGVSQVQGYIFGKPSTAEVANAMANAVTEARRLQLRTQSAPPADAPRDRLDRRTADRNPLAQHVRDGRARRMRKAARAGHDADDRHRRRRASRSARCAGHRPTGSESSSPSEFDLTRLAPRQERSSSSAMLSHWHVGGATDRAAS